MGLFKELMNAVENRLYGTGATATDKENNGVPVSYTHLTLPTILRV